MKKVPGKKLLLVYLGALYWRALVVSFLSWGNRVNFYKS